MNVNTSLMGEVTQQNAAIKSSKVASDSGGNSWEKP